mgnify:CR=1 FL=1
MIIGDAGYGMLILIGTIVFAVKTKGEKKYSNIVTYYLYFQLQPLYGERLPVPGLEWSQQ